MLSRRPQRIYAVLAEYSRLPVQALVTASSKGVAVRPEICAAHVKKPEAHVSMSNLSSDYPNLRAVCEGYPAIDNHAHPLLKLAYRDAMTFENIISESSDEALQDSIYSLACYRASEQLAKLFGLNGEDATWEKVKTTRREMEYIKLCRTCFEPSGIQCILIDDGLEGCKDYAEYYKWHDRFTRSPTKRIVRLETSAEDILLDILETIHRDHLDQSTESILQMFNTKFRDLIFASEKDREVVGFKSIAAYRTGLAVSTSGSQADIEKSLGDAIKSYRESGDRSLRLQHKPFNDYIIRMALDLARKPVQFHTGLGDADLLLATATPTLLQPLIRAYPGVTFVLLHSSWPFSQEAGYLAAMYKNVFLDFGEVFPQVSAQGQRVLVHGLLELCPTNKIMWSTDGHWWPEVFYLGSLQAREVLYDVLSELVGRKEMTEKSAIEIVKAALFGNANRIYALGLEPYPAPE